MTNLTLIDPGWPEFSGRTYAPALVSEGRLLWTSGLNALTADGSVVHPGDIVAQARVIYGKLGELLRRCGAGPSDVVKTTDFVVTRDGYRQTAAVREAFFGDHRPVSTGVVVRELFGRGVLIEIEAVAVLHD